MSNQKIPILSHFQIENCIFFDGQKCDFTKIPRPFHIVSEIKRGKAVFTSANKTITLKEGDVFFIPKGENATDYTDEVIARLNKMCEIATKRNIQLCHENEKGIFGQNPTEVNTLVDNVPGLKFIFDGANYRECDCDTIAGINATLKRLGYLHIKDAIFSPHMIVPAGEGEAKLDEVIEMVNKATDEVVYLTLEPHLHIFDAFKDIDDTELKGKYTFKTQRKAFDCAVNALKSLLKRLGYERNGENEWIK